MIDIEEFLDIAKDINRPWEGRDSIPCRKTEEIERNYLWMSHCTGGKRGGSCWSDDGPTRFTSDTPVPAFTELYTLYEKICPNITFIQAHKIESTLVDDTTSTDCGDYYGNHREYFIKYIHLPSLYKYMVDNNLINEG